MIYVQSTNFDLLLKNYLHRDTQRLVFPLVLMQYLMFCPKYCIRYNFITSNGFIANLILVSYSTIVILTYSYSYFKYLNQSLLIPKFSLIYTLLFQHLLFCAGFIANALVSILHSQINVELLISVQIIRNNITVYHKVDRRILFGNWAYIIIIFIFYSTNFFIQVTKIFSSYFLIIMLIVIVLPPDINIIYAAGMIKLLKEEICCWISEFKSISDDTTITENDIQNIRWNAILKAYFAIIEAYSVCEKVIGIPVVYYVFMTFLQCIMNIQILIELNSINIILVLCIMWSVKSAFLLSVLCYQCESVYITLKNAQVVCVTTPLQEYWSDSVRIKWKTLHQEGKKKRLPLKASGLLTVNANLPLQLLSVFAAYTVVLLQFNFL